MKTGAILVWSPEEWNPVHHTGIATVSAIYMLLTHFPAQLLSYLLVAGACIKYYIPEFSFL